MHSMSNAHNAMHKQVWYDEWKSAFTTVIHYPLNNGQNKNQNHTVDAGHKL